MIRSLIVLCVLQSAGFAQTSARARCPNNLGNVRTFAAVYYDETSLAKLGKFDMVVLDPANYSADEVTQLKSLGCMPVAYLNIGEVETYRKYFSIADTGLFLSPDPYWRNRYYADICSPKWQQIVLGDRIPAIVSKGYCGLFIDLSGLLTEYPGKEDCTVSILKKIRKETPGISLILDGGLGILDRVGNLLDGVAVEGLMGFYDFNADTYEIRRDSTEDRESRILLQAAKRFKFRIFQLDYADPADAVDRNDIILKSRRLGFVPYVGTVELDTLFMNTVQPLKIPTTDNKVPFPD